jgi:iron complex transport system ATP-binding protein
MSAPVLEAAGVSVRLNGRLVVEHATLNLRRGEVVALVGPNGAGKTTLVRALAGLIPADGEIVLEQRALGAYAPRERARRIAYLPQGHVFHWPIPAADAVALGRYPHADPFTPPTEADRAAVARAMAATTPARDAVRRPRAGDGLWPPGGRWSARRDARAGARRRGVRRRDRDAERRRPAPHGALAPTVTIR